MSTSDGAGDVPQVVSWAVLFAMMGSEAAQDWYRSLTPYEQQTLQIWLTDPRLRAIAPIYQSGARYGA